jgi:hypothetical protein
MTTPRPLKLLVERSAASRTASDRLQILQALITAPSFDPLFRGDVLRIPADHPVYGWRCQVQDCDRSKEGSWDLCHRHQIEWAGIRGGGATFTSFLAAAKPFTARSWSDARPCRICPDLPAVGQWGLCDVHAKRWSHCMRWTRMRGRTPQFEDWLLGQAPLPGMGKCQVLACSELADHTPLRMCSRHRTLYTREGRPGDARVPDLRKWVLHAGQRNGAEITYGDEAAFRNWCQNAPAVFRMNGTLSLLGLRPLVKAEIQWTLFNHTQGPREGARWHLRFVQHLAEHCRTRDAGSLADLDLDRVPVNSSKMAKTMLNELRLVYFSREDTKQTGCIETAHYGVHFPYCGSHIDLTMISQTWLRDLLWDHFDTRLRNDPPRSQGTFKNMRRACAELSAYLEIQAPNGGHRPALLTENHMIDFIADQRHRARFGLEPLGRHEGPTGKQGRQAKNGVTTGAVARNFNGARTVLRAGMDAGTTAAIGLDQRFIVAIPTGGTTRGKRGRPFSDATARALANDANLALLDERDAEDRGLRDIWETLVFTGRRCNEVIRLRLDCVGRVNGLPLLWHDQTKVGNLDDGIRIPERLVQRIEVRQAKTIDRFVQRNGRPPTPEERTALALFPAVPPTATAKAA